jgi:YHS domain-containing protein
VFAHRPTQLPMKQHLLASAVLWFVAATTSLGADKSLLNLDKQGVALQGYDPVAFFTVKAPLKGKPEFKSTAHSATYWFHSAKSKAAFDAKPEKHEPRFGGYCAYGVSKGRLIEIDVEAFQIIDGQLLLQYSQGVRDDFNKDAEGNLKKAEANWPKLVEKKGR